jgi:hypothetical protein
VRCRAIGALAAALGASLLAATAWAGANFVHWPEGFERSYVLLLQVDKIHTAELRRVYMNPEAVRQVKPNAPLPHGTRIVMADWTAKLGADGKPIVDPQGHFVPDKPIVTLIQEKQPGWGDRRRVGWGAMGEWEFALFRPEGELIVSHGSVYLGCFECHRTRPDMDYTYTVGRYFADRFAAGKGLPPLPGAPGR